MKFSTVASVAALFYQSAFGIALPHESSRKPPYFILTGDSTVAINGGWGNGFLSFVKPPAEGINPAKGGATTASFRAEGLWSKALQAVKDNAVHFRPIVTIQFGHNDQKAAANISPEQFRSNLETMSKEVIEAGGTPIIITSLTRRTFENGQVIQNLKEHTELAIQAAKAVGAQVLDLNLASTNYVNAIGQENSQYYNLNAGDRTHLNPKGEIVFGRLVVDLLLDQRKDLDCYFEANHVLSEKLRKGEFATGDE